MHYSTVLIALAFIGPVSCNGVPGFSWDGSRTSEFGVPHLTITFPDGQTDVALLERHNPIPVAENEREMDVDICIFRGKLLHNPEVPIAVTGGCPFTDSFEISIFSDKLSHNLYKVKNGVATGLKIPSTNYVKPNIESVQNVTSEPTLESRQHASSYKTLPSSGFVAKVKLFYDTSFGYNFDVTNTLRRVMTHVQTFYWLKQSLTTTVTIEVVGQPEMIPETVLADDYYLNWVSKEHSKDPNVHFNVYLGYEYSNDEGFVGLAWPGVACNKEIRWRSSVNEYYHTDIQTAGVVAHEMGHNLGMYHDFDDSGDRYDNNGQPCAGIGGIMDYYSTQIKWSPCSVEDFTKYYGQFDTFCIPLNTNPVPSIPTLTTMSTTTTASCRPDLLSDEYCDDFNNNDVCGFDGGDCCHSPNPDYTRYCKACECINPSVTFPTTTTATTTTTTTTTTTSTTTTEACDYRYSNDKYCDDFNNRAECGYDGGDCCNNSNPNYKETCKICECLAP